MKLKNLIDGIFGIEGITKDTEISIVNNKNMISSLGSSVIKEFDGFRCIYFRATDVLFVKPDIGKEIKVEIKTNKILEIMSKELSARMMKAFSNMLNQNNITKH